MLLRKFNEVLQRRPLATQMVVSGAVCGAGDVFAQYITKEPKWDAWRTARFTGLAAFLIAPPLNVWFRFLERIVHANKNVMVMKRMAMDQFIFSPVFNGIILVNLKFFEGYSPQKSFEIAKDLWYDVYTNSLKIWPFVQLFNFYVMPLNYRVILVQFVAFFWNTYLSYRTQK